MEKFVKTAFAILLATLSSVVIADDEVIVPGKNLVIEGIPPIPVALADEVDRYTRFRATGLGGWHPTKRELLVTTRFASTNQIHYLKFPGGAQKQLTFFKDRADDAIFQPTRGDYFIFRKGAAGDENHQRYRYDFVDGKITLLTDGKSRNTGGKWSNAGDKFAYQSTRRNSADTDIWIMNPAEPKSDRMLAKLTGGGWWVEGFSPDDKRLVVSEYISANESYLWLVDAATGEKTLITPKGGAEKSFYGSAEFSRDGKGIYVTTDRESEFRRLAYVDLATKKHTYLSDAIKWDVEFFSLAWDGKTLAFVTNEDGVSVLHLLDTSRHSERPVPKLPAGVIGELAWNKNNRDLGFGMESAHSTYDVYSIDVQSGKTERWTEGETGGIDVNNFLAPQLVQWPSFDGKTISGIYFRPPAKFTGKRPVIIDIHGGPEEQARPVFQGRNNYFINEMGIAFIHPNVRGSTGYGKTFLKLDNGVLREGAYKDILALLDWIKTRPDLDADRVMVMGGSYGGNVTLAIAAFYPERIRCAIDVVGASNFVTFLENTSAYRRDLRRAEYGDERDPNVRAVLNRIAPLNHAEKITKPLFVVQGGNDPRVPLSESEQITRTVRKNGTPVWYLMAKDEGHGFAKKDNRDFQFYATVQFIKEYLLK